MKNNLRRENRKSQYRKNRLFDRQIANRERINLMSQEKQKTIENQMEINKLVRKQTELITLD